MNLNKSDIDEIAQDIRKQLRLSMDGFLSMSMRKKGIDYKLNFGIPIPKIRQIAKKYTKNCELSLTLWEKNVRELKILATLLFPEEECSQAVARKMASELPNQEIREQLCMNLLQNVAFAHELVISWMSDVDEKMRITAYWLFVRLSVSKSPLLQKFDTMLITRQALQDVKRDDTFLKNAALLALKHIGRNVPRACSGILDAVKDCPEIHDTLQFEFEFYANP